MKILISGYYGFGNVGDEAVLEAMLEGFQKRDPAVKTTVLSTQRCDLFKILTEIADCDVFLSGGGSLFQDTTSSRSFLYYIGLVFLAKLFRKKAMIFAQGIGPLRKKINRLIAGFILDRVDLITLRDEDSRTSLVKMGVRRPPIYVTADPALLLKVPEASEGERIMGLEGIPSGRPLVGVSIRNIARRPEMEEMQFRRLAENLDYLVEKHGLTPVFLLFRSPEDMTKASKVMGMMKHKSQVVFKNCRLNEMFSLFPKFKLLIGMRLHSLIFAALCRVPMLGISYDPKVRAFMKTIGQPCINIDERPERIKELLDEIVKSKDAVKRELDAKNKMLYDSANLNFDLFFRTFVK